MMNNALGRDDDSDDGVFGAVVVRIGSDDGRWRRVEDEERIEGARKPRSSTRKGTRSLGCSISAYDGEICRQVLYAIALIPSWRKRDAVEGNFFRRRRRFALAMSRVCRV